MATPAAIRDAIQTRLDTVSGLRAFDLVNGKVPTPSAWVRPESHRQETIDDAATWVFTVDVYVSLNSMRAGQNQLDGFLPGGANDVRAAVEGTLGGTVDAATCDLTDGSYGLKEIDGVVYLGCEFRVEVLD